jgi:hypothetical protein
MKQIRRNMVFILLLSLVSLYCKREDNIVLPEDLPPFLYGKVTDNQGNLLEDVAIHYIYKTVASSLNKSLKICPTTQITFSIPKRANVSLKIYRWYTMDLIATLVDTIKEAGYYAIPFDVTKITNGCYIYRLLIDSTVTEKHMWLLETDIQSLINATPLTKSNSTGQFSLPLEIFGIGMQTLTSGSSPTDIDTVYISHSIQLVLYKNGYRTLVSPMTIDPTKGIRETFKLEK